MNKTTAQKFITLPILILLASLLVATASADPQSSRLIQNHRVYYSSFNSSFIKPEIAAAYKIIRAKNRGLVNIAAVPVDNEAGGGRSALVKGTVSNLFGQQQTLKFMEIREGDIVYYLAPFKFSNEDSLTFKISVKLDPNKPAESFSFQNIFHFD